MLESQRSYSRHKLRCLGALRWYLLWPLLLGSCRFGFDAVAMGDAGGAAGAAGTGTPNGSGGAAVTVGAGGSKVVATGGSASGASMGGAGVSGESTGGDRLGGATAGSGGTTEPSLTTDYVGQWFGTSKSQGNQYEVELAVAPADVGERVSIFYLPGTPVATCGGIGRLVSVGASLVYDETLLFGSMAYCLGASQATLSLISASSLDYDWLEPNSSRHHRGVLTRRSQTGAAVAAGFQGMWTGTLQQSMPSATREVFIVVDQAAIGEPVAQLLYVSAGNRCGGQASLVSAAAGSLVLSEALTVAGEGCPPDGSITLIPEGNALAFAWSSSSSATTATGVVQSAR